MLNAHKELFIHNRQRTLKSQQLENKQANWKMGKRPEQKPHLIKYTDAIKAHEKTFICH